MKDFLIVTGKTVQLSHVRNEGRDQQVKNWLDCPSMVLNSELPANSE